MPHRHGWYISGTVQSLSITVLKSVLELAPKLVYGPPRRRVLRAWCQQARAAIHTGSDFTGADGGISARF